MSLRPTREASRESRSLSACWASRTASCMARTALRDLREIEPRAAACSRRTRLSLTCPHRARREQVAGVRRHSCGGNMQAGRKRGLGRGIAAQHVWRRRASAFPCPCGRAVVRTLLVTTCSERRWRTPSPRAGGLAQVPSRSIAGTAGAQVPNPHPTLTQRTSSSTARAPSSKPASCSSRAE